jgi:phosphohistidine swiveling domain-containing protein
MNDRSRKTLVTLIGVAGSMTAAMSVIVFGKLPNIASTVLLATLAGTLGNLAFTGLGILLMRLEKRLTRGRPGDCVYAFGKLPFEEGNSAGGKGRVLADLFQRGFPVPDGCILLPDAFSGDALTDEAWEKVQGQLARLRRGKTISFAVRSSALSEDSAQASFAGEFESVLDVQSDQEIRAAISAVRASLHSVRVQAYSQAKGLEANEHPIAVIIQKLVHSDTSGVLFTVDPLTGNLMQMTGNLVAGMGDKLVSGSVSAATFTFKRTEGVYNGPAELQRISKTLHREAHEIEQAMGCPQDIEWTVAGKKLFILQSRPITTLNGYNPVTAEANDTFKGRFLWSATNLMEACPEVMTPFTASLLLYLNQRGGPALTVKNYPLNGVIGGRFYANISVQVTAFARMFKGDTHRTYREMAGWWGEIPDEMEIPLLPLTKQEWQRVLMPGLWRTTRQFNKYRKQRPEFLRQNRQKCAQMRDKARQAANKRELLALWHTEIFPAYRDSMIHIVAAGSDVQIRLERELRDLVGKEDANALLSNLSGPSAKLESMGPMAGLGMVLRGQMSRETYLENYGHRGVNEGECAWPRPAEDPLWLERQLEEWKKTPVDVETLMARQSAAYASAWDRFCQKYPRKVKSMQKHLAQVARAAQQRELVRSEGTRRMTALRAFALRAGEMLEIGEGVFFLTIDEVLAALAGETSAIQTICTRQEIHRRYRALPTYPAIICGRFDPFAWAADPNRRSDIFDTGAQIAPAPAAFANANTITGAAGALGVVEGIVRRLDCLEESGQFQAGEVLVTTMTNIGWTPIFPRAAAIVTDLGAPLSHAAIVARELGIPAVVGCGNATMRLKTGDRVRVNGGKGLVEILI